MLVQGIKTPKAIGQYTEIRRELAYGLEHLNMVTRTEETNN